MFSLFKRSKGVVLQNLADHDRAVFARIDRNLARRPAERFPDNFDSVPLVRVFAAEFFQRFGRPQKRYAAGKGISTSNSRSSPTGKVATRAVNCTRSG